ncbi:hypothetical protein B0H16DRAFT_1236997, partial [Mycena metata]
MALPKDVATLCAKGTGNLTRPDNVFVSAELLDRFISCDAYPHLTPGTTDHFPIISEIDVVVQRTETVDRWNWRAANWEEMEKMLAAELEAVEVVEGYAGVVEVEMALEELDGIIWRCVKEHVPIAKVSPHSKRWWTTELSAFRKEREKLARKSFRQRNLQDSPIHEQYRVARNSF